MSRILCFLVPCICVMASNAAHAALVYKLEFAGIPFGAGIHPDRWDYGGGRFIIADGFQGEITAENVDSVLVDWSIRFTSPYNPRYFDQLEHPGSTTYVLTRANSDVTYHNGPQDPKLVVGPETITMPSDGGYLWFSGPGVSMEYGPGHIWLFDHWMTFGQPDADFSIEAAYGNGLPVPTIFATAVPEPTAGVLFSLSLVIGYAFQRRRPAAG